MLQTPSSSVRCATPSKAFCKISVQSLEDFFIKGIKSAKNALIMPNYANQSLLIQSLEKIIFDLQVSIPGVHSWVWS